MSGEGESLGESSTWFLSLFLLLMNGFFVMAEFGLVSLRFTRIEQLAAEGKTIAEKVKKMLETREAYLAACQVGITLTSLGLGRIGEPTMAHLLEPLFQAGFRLLQRMGLPLSAATIDVINSTLSFILVTFLVLVLGEQLPKLIAISNAERFAMWTAHPLDLFYRISFPLTWLVNKSVDQLMRRLHVDSPAHEAPHSEEEIKFIVNTSHQHGVLDETERELLDNVLEFSDKVAREVMIPRTDMVCLYVEDSLEENLEVARREGHTRYPLCLEDKDHIVGMIHIKDLFMAESKKVSNLLDLKREIPTVAEATPISRVLKLMQKRRAQMAVVVDEYGGTAGVVTMENLLEELVGSIQDEHDLERPEIEVLDEWRTSVDGSMLIDEVNDFFDLHIDTDEVDTIAGYVMMNLPLPKVGDILQIAPYEVAIQEMDGFRIKRLLFTLLEPSKGSGETGGSGQR
jgi:CBS domain containing-hemolysin-like protein